MERIKVLIVLADFYKEISKNLLDSVCEFFKKQNVEYDYVFVPGALEIAPTIKFNHDGKNNYDGYVALGCVIKGETYHFEIVANESARALCTLSLNYSIPIGNGILTTYNKEQALVRSKASKLNKGKEAALACLSMIKIKKESVKL